MGKLKIWATQEDEILTNISTVIKSKRWKKASEELRRHGYIRSDVECRQRYINHLDPSVNKQLWSDEELEILYTKYQEYGNKWFLLQKNLPGRTQTKIKNYFYGNIRYFLKVVIKHFHRKSTGFVNDIKTETLLDVYEAKNDFQGFEIVPRTIYHLKYRINKASCEKIICQHEEEFQRLARIFIQAYFQKNVSLRKQEEIKSEQEQQQQSKPVADENGGKVATAVSIVNSVGGEFTDLKSEMEYLRSMSQFHYDCYQLYSKRFFTLLEKGNPSEEAND